MAQPTWYQPSGLQVRMVQTADVDTDDLSLLLSVLHHLVTFTELQDASSLGTKEFNAHEKGSSTSWC